MSEQEDKKKRINIEDLPREQEELNEEEMQEVKGGTLPGQTRWTDPDPTPWTDPDPSPANRR